MGRQVKASDVALVGAIVLFLIPVVLLKVHLRGIGSASLSSHLLAATPAVLLAGVLPTTIVVASFARGWRGRLERIGSSVLALYSLGFLVFGLMCLAFVLVRSGFLPRPDFILWIRESSPVEYQLALTLLLAAPALGVVWGSSHVGFTRRVRGLELGDNRSNMRWERHIGRHVHLGLLISVLFAVLFCFLAHVCLWVNLPGWLTSVKIV